MQQPRAPWTRIAIALSAVAACAWAATFAIDFSVYWTIARSDGPLYGEPSGLVWPMWFRYPPLFRWLVEPFALPPLRVGAFLFALGKLAAMGAVLAALSRRIGATRSVWGLAFLAGGYWWLCELRFGNAQGYVFALVAAALLWADERPRTAAASLGLAVALKVWPLFFVPYLAARRRFSAAAATLAWGAGFTLLPAVWSGWSAHAASLRAWYEQESAIAQSGGSIWFPSQSLLGVMTRHLTPLSWDDAPDPNYPTVNWLSLDPGTVQLAWVTLVVVGCLLLWRRAWKLPSAAEPTAAAAAFCALVLLEPYAQRQTALVVMAWPALVAARQAWRGPCLARVVFGAAVAVVLLQPLTPSAWQQRVFEVWGLDALAVILLLAASQLRPLIAEDPSADRV